MAGGTGLEQARFAETGLESSTGVEGSGSFCLFLPGD